MYNITVPLAMFGIVPLALLVVGWLRPVRGVTAVIVLGWLFLPMAVFKAPMLPLYTKHAAVSLSAFMALLVFDAARLLGFRPRWVDIPMFVWCLSPSASSIANGLGLQDALVVFLDQILIWGIPYLIGRTYFGTLSSIDVLARGLVFGGLVYVPLCMYEMRMSPVLHSSLYGFHQHQFLQSVREGGYRPTVFMQHGLAVAFFMASGALACIWFWRSRVETRLLGVPIAWIALTATAVALLCRSTGAIALLTIGILALYGARAFRSKWVLVPLVLAAPVYMCVRATGVWSGQSLVEVVRELSADRADSLQCRLTSENILSAHALNRPLFGWGGWGGNYTDGGKGENVIQDGYWIIVLGRYGVIGLAAFATTMLLPTLLLLLRAPRALVFSKPGAAAIVLGTTVCLFTVDCLFNAMLNPIYVLAVGGLSGIGTVALKPAAGRARRRTLTVRAPARAAPRTQSHVIDIPSATPHDLPGGASPGGVTEGPGSR